MIKKQPLVALAASVVLVLSGCETTDSLAGKEFSVVEEENNVIELFGKNLSGVINLPTSDKTEGEDSEENKSDETEKTDSEKDGESTEESKDENKSDESADESTDESKDENTGDESGDEKTDEASGDETKDESSDESKDNVESADESKSEDSDEKSEESGNEENKGDEESTNPSDAGGPSKNVNDTEKTEDLKDVAEEKSEETKDESADEEKSDETKDESTEEKSDESKDDEKSDGASEESKDETKSEDETKDDQSAESSTGNESDDQSTEEKSEETKDESAEEKSEETKDESTEDKSGESKDDEESDGATEESKDETKSEDETKDDQSAESSTGNESDDQSTEEKSEETKDETADEKSEETKDESTEDKSDESKDDEKSDSATDKTESDGKTESDSTEDNGNTGTAPSEEKTEEKSEEKTEEETTPEKDYSTNNKILMQKVEAARLAAVDAGASSVSPIIWAATEGIYKTEKAAVDSGTKADLSPVLNDLIARYNGLENLAQAKDLKDEIDENNFASYRQATYNAGKEIMDDLLNPLAVVQSGNDFNKQAATAESDFRLVLRTAYNSLAQDERTKAYEAKLKADSVKAYVSRKDEYTHAVSLYRNGELRRSVDPKIANDSYRMSKEEFLTLYDEISAARNQAQKEIDEAKKSVAQSATVAEQADVEAPLGNEPVDGIEAADAKLLEDDDFSDAGEAAEIEAPVDEQ